MPLETARLKTIAKRLDWAEWIIWIGMGAWAAWAFVTQGRVFMGVFAVILLAPGIAKLMAHPKAWHVSMVSWLGMNIAGAYIVLTGPTVWRAICLLGTLWGLRQCYQQRPGNNAAASDETDEATASQAADSAAGGPEHSLVLWLREPRFLDESILSRTATDAFDLPFNNAENAESFIVGKENIYMLRVQGELYHLHQWHRSYFEDPAAAAASIRELRRADAIRRHQAWIAIDHMPLGEGVPPADVLLRIGRLAAALAADGDDVIAVYHPPSGRIAPWDASLREKLASAEPLSAFTEPAQVPVIQVESDSPAMVAAVEEARRRWPEFVAAFRAASKPDRFSVKAPVTEGENTEFIWIEVKAIADGRIHGFLANEPVALGDLKLGAFVSVAEAELNDWVFPDPADATRPLGLFTVKAVTDAAGA
jgi:uncharacterized protein YegJ (DUF2314 family)